MFWWFTRCLYSQELEDTIESLRQQISVLQSRARVLQEELDSGNQFSSSFSISAVRDQDELWSNWRKKVTSNKYITEWSAGFLWSRTRHYCLTFESEKSIYPSIVHIPGKILVQYSFQVFLLHLWLRRPWKQALCLRHWNTFVLFHLIE